MTNSLGDLLGRYIDETRGIVLRYIPRTRIAIYSDRHFENKDAQELFYDEKRQARMMRETKVNSNGGKWLAIHNNDSSDTTRWYKSEYVIADTPEEAIRLLMEKTNG